MIFIYEEGQPDRMKIGNGRDPFSKLLWYEDVTKANKDAIGQPDGLVPLNSNGVVPSKYIPEDLRKSIDPPIVESLTYTGELQSPAIYVDNMNGQTLTGDLSAVEIGQYMMAAKPAPGYKWSDGSVETVFIPWSIKES